jgi:hypothetical protein
LAHEPRRFFSDSPGEDLGAQCIWFPPGDSQLSPSLEADVAEDELHALPANPASPPTRIPKGTGHRKGGRGAAERAFSTHSRVRVVVLPKRARDPSPNCGEELELIKEASFPPARALSAHLPELPKAQQQRAARLRGSREPPPTRAAPHVLGSEARRGSCSLRRPSALPRGPAPLLRGYPWPHPQGRGPATSPEATPPARARLGPST